MNSSKLSVAADWIIRVSGAAASVIGAVWLLAWLTGRAAQWSAAGILTMKMNMGIALLLAGAALLLMWPEQPTRPYRILGSIAASVVLATGMLTLSEHMFGWDLGIDQLFAKEPLGALATSSPNRIGVLGSASDAILGLGLLCLAGNRRRFSPYLGLVVILINIVPAVGFLYGIVAFYSLPRLSGIAWPTVIAMLCLGLGLVFSHRSSGPAALILREDPGGLMLRRTLPAAVLIPLVLGWLIVAGEQHHFYDTPTGTALLVLLMIILFAFTLWRGAAGLSHSAASQRNAEDTIKHSLERFELLASTAGQLLQSSEPQKVVESLCRKVMEHLDCHAFFNYLADERAGRLHLNACAGIPNEKTAQIEWLDYGIAVCGCAARDGCRIVAEHIPTTPDQRTQLVKSFGIKAYACHPLLGSSGEVIGTLSFGTRSRETFSENDLSLMKAVADHVAVAMVRMQTERSLRRMVSELERSNRELEQFAYISAHDLQEPLRQVRSYVQLVKERYGEKFDGKGAQCMGFIYEGANRMSALVTGLLAYSQIGGRDRKREKVACEAALMAALGDLKALIDESGAHITYDGLPTLPADNMQLVQLFENLVGNAIKFRRNGISPDVHIGCRRDGGKWLFWVKDNGIGIDPQYHEKVFLIFQRLHGLGKYAGTGIGLAICKKIVEQHGGRIWLESKADEGATFYFTLHEDST